MEEVPNLINIGPTNPIQILNQHDFLNQMILSTKIKNLDVYTGAPQRKQEVY